MIISDKHKFVYIHVPRTGGNSVKEMWADKFEAHKSHTTFKNGVKRFGKGRTFEDYFRFGFIRNPWERVYSLFWKHVKNSPLDTSRGFKHWMFDETRTDSQRHKESAMHYLKGVNYIAKFENFEEEWDIIFEKIGLERAPVPHVYKYKDNKAYQDLYDDEMRAFIVKYHQEDIDRGSYIF